MAKVSYAGMLTLILGQARESRELLPAWGQTFATMHGLDYNMIAAQARRPNPMARVYHEYGRAVNFATRYRIDGSHKLPIDNVYDAAIVSDTSVAHPAWTPEKLAADGSTDARQACGRH